MTKERWQEHREETGVHAAHDCPQCQDRKKTILANARARSIRATYSDLGMVRVKGSLGGVYYE